MHILVLGGYGFIGLAVARRLASAGHKISCMGRSADVGLRLFPSGNWIAADISALQSSATWKKHLDSVDVVVNAAGALQSGLRDDVHAIHHRAVAALVAASAKSGIKRFIQISAVGARLDAETQFMRSKARGDHCLRDSELSWVILMPGLVIGAPAYGGTALIRTIASVPVILAIVYGDRRVQTVHLSDLADVVLDAAEGRIPARSELDVVEDEPHTLRSLLQEFRRWLGIGKAHRIIEVPEWIALSVAKAADILGYLGWRSPLRTTALRVLAQDVVGDAQTLRAVSDRRLSGLKQTLERLPSTLQERWFAKMYLLLPIIIAALSIFGVFSGLIALAHLDAAEAQSGLPAVYARPVALGGSFVDIALGAIILYRPWARRAAWGMFIVGLLYLLAATGLRHDLWADPLGPILKIVPATILALIATVFLDSGR